jgi:hypothetical protein
VKARRPATRASLEALELDAVRLDCRIAQSPLLVFLVGFEIALEPFDVAVALEGEAVLGDPIKKEAIV